MDLIESDWPTSRPSGQSMAHRGPQASTRRNTYWRSSHRTKVDAGARNLSDLRADPRISRRPTLIEVDHRRTI
jgi:hypothetical protein